MLDDAVPPVRARFRLNDADERRFHVEELPDRDTDWVNGYKSTPAELRCRELGEICVEIPVANRRCAPAEIGFCFERMTPAAMRTSSR